jgi:hypothetical protein
MTPHMKIFKSPTENDIPESSRMTSTERVRALYSAQWGFYKYGFDTMLKIAGVELLIIVILAIALLCLAAAEAPAPKYFWVNSQRQIGEIQPLSEASTQEAHVRQFISDGVLEAMNFTYDDYQQRQEKSSIYFTDDGFAAWTNALKDSGVFSQIKEQKLLLRTVLTAVPSIIKDQSKAYGSTFIWVYNVEVLRTVSSSIKVLTNNYKYKILVRQVPFSEKASGLAIYSIKEVPRGQTEAP